MGSISIKVPDKWDKYLDRARENYDPELKTNEDYLLALIKDIVRDQLVGEVVPQAMQTVSDNISADLAKI